MTEHNIEPILRDFTFPIETKRLTLRPVQPGDGQELYNAKEETWDQLVLWMDWTESRDNLKQTEAYVRESYAQWIRREQLVLAGFCKETGLLSVMTGLHHINWKAGFFRTGYWVRQSMQGKGFATESTRGLIRFVFEELQGERLEIEHDEGNDASRRIVEKCGFIKEGVMRNGSRTPSNRALRDRHFYALIKEDYLKTKEIYDV